MLSASQLAARPPVREVAQVRNTVVDELRLMSLIRLAGRPRDGLSRKVALRRIEALERRLVEVRQVTRERVPEPLACEGAVDVERAERDGHHNFLRSGSGRSHQRERSVVQRREPARVGPLDEHNPALLAHPRCS